MEYYVLSHIFQLFTSGFSNSNEELSVNFISVSGSALEKQFKLCSVLSTSGFSSGLAALSFECSTTFRESWK